MIDTTTVLLKACQKCKCLQLADCYHKDKTCKDGLCRKCKDCVKAYHLATREDRTENARRWRFLNPEKVKMILTRYAEKRKEKSGPADWEALARERMAAAAEKGEGE